MRRYRGRLFHLTFTVLAVSFIRQCNICTYNYMNWLVSLPVVASLPSSDSHSRNRGNGESDYDNPDDGNPNDDSDRDDGDPDNSNPDNGNPNTNDSDNRASDASYSNDS